MTDAAAVDVGMPAHGRPVFLAEAIESVLGQTHRELRLILLDDSSDEEIGRVAERYSGDGRLEHRRSEPLSATGAMTALLQAAEAPYFAFLHDDDRWEPGFLARRVAFLESHRDCGLVFSGHVDIDEEGRETARYPAPFPEGVVPREQLVPQMLERNVIDVMHSVLARRAVLEAAGAYLDDSFPRVFDWELWLRVVVEAPVGCIDAEDAAYRVHGAQMSGVAGRARDFSSIARHGDRLVAERAPDLALPERARRRRDARLELSAALDLLQEDDASGARTALRGALRSDARTVLADRRLAAAVLGLVGGRRGRRAVGRLRQKAYGRRRQI